MQLTVEEQPGFAPGWSVRHTAATNAIRLDSARVRPGERKIAEQSLNAGYALADLACRTWARLRHGAEIWSGDVRFLEGHDGF